MPRLILITLALSAGAPCQQPTDFARDVLPILSDNCFRCHGPDGNARQAGLRLDLREDAVAQRDNGAAIVPGDPTRSRLLARVRASDPAERMPPSHTGKQLTDEQVLTLERWVRDGAPWGRHWSFVPPRRPSTPADSDPIDHFVSERLRSEGLQPSPPADKRTLIRRVSFDLTGLPPTKAQVRAFVEDRSPDAYERLVDRLLDSPHYGERMAMAWLDAARYADTDGFQADATRTNWPWRDWVVDAYNQNMGFDRFTVLQFAGDLMPDATPEQVLATCFHRNHMTNGEGGRHAEESRIDYVMDRVNTMGTAFMGMTLGCAQCHDHKFDPISQREYYGLNGFFNSIEETGAAGGKAGPYLSYKSPRVGPGLKASEGWLKDRQQDLKRVEAEAREGFAPWLEALARAARRDDARSWHTLTPTSLRSTHGTALTVKEDGVVTASAANPRHEDYLVTGAPTLPRLTGMRLEVLPGPDGKLSEAPDGHIILTNLKVSVRSANRQRQETILIRSAVADVQSKKQGWKDYGPVADSLDDDPRTGWASRDGSATTPCQAVFRFDRPVSLDSGEDLLVELRHRSLSGHANIRRFRVSFTDEAGAALTRIGVTAFERLVALEGEVSRLEKRDRDELLQRFFADHPDVAAARDAVARAKRRRTGYGNASKALRVMVLKEREEPRTTHVLERGVWDQKGDQVEPMVPQSLAPGQPRDRLELAQWLVTGDHPLTARVAVNRYWQMSFGAGLVRTPEDFGLQGQAPTHPLLLDWLASEFVSSGWDIKHLRKLIVMSATYRQQSIVNDALLTRDPENRLLARMSRFRLPSWMIRDAALAYSGLLNRRMGGPPVYPYQPEGVWAAFTMGRFHYQHSVGDDLYRRSIYSFWRRLVAPTAMFDASRRRTCQTRVIRTNTPLQALTLMNDTTFVEASRVLAARCLQAHEETAARLTGLFEQAVGRTPDPTERAVLLQQYGESHAYYAANLDEASALLTAGQAHHPRPADVAAHAALTTVATTVLNLDEVVTRE